METIATEDQLGLTVCNRQPLAFERGLGSHVWDDKGERYLDFTSGWGVTSLGHSHPALVSAIAKQAGKLMQNPNSGFTYSPVRARLLQKLTAVLPPQPWRLFFANSGAEANDAAVKLARKATGRRNVIAMSGSFHGRTLATLSLSGSPDNAAKYLPIVPGNLFLSFADLESLQKVIGDDVAAVIVEPVQGEGGVRPLPPGFLSALAEMCQRHGVLLIVDEVQTGFCRTGRFFAFEAEDVVPDILTMGKGIAGGFPFAALAVSGSVAANLHKGDHGGTYCGNPLGCAAALAVVEHMVDNRVAEHVAALGREAMYRLQEIAMQAPSVIREVRGQGLLIGLQLHTDEQVALLTQACLQQRLLVTPTRNAVVRLLPNLLMIREELHEGLGILAAAVSQLGTVRSEVLRAG